MAFVHADASITPSKSELLDAWVPTQPWAREGTTTTVGSYRLDDPDGEVGLEAFLLRQGDGPVLHVPLTYRGAPLPGVEPITTMEHTVLGPRWVYDGALDPVLVATLVATALTGGTQADQEYERDGVRRTREPDVRVTGSGSPGSSAPALEEVTTRSDAATTTVRSGGLEVVLARVVPLDAKRLAGPVTATLTGTWPGVPEPVLLAAVRLG